MADDLGYGEPSYMGTTSPHGTLATPNIDRLSSEGLRFTSAYTGEAVCAPSRGSFMTGYHTGHAYIRGNVQGAFDLPLPSSAVTFGQVLKEAGYHTMWVGKSGLGWINSTGAPSELGFEQYFGQVDQTGCHNMYPVSNVSDPAGYRETVFNGTTPLLFQQNVGASRDRCMAPGGGGCWYTHEAWRNASLLFLQEEGRKAREARAQGAEPQPFMLYWADTVPHAGGWELYEEQGAPVPSDGSYSKHAGEWPPVEMDHASVISNYLDPTIGAIFDALAREGLDEDTIVFFASDNGAHNEGGHEVTFFNSSGPLRGYKRSLWEGGIRTPSWVRWPGTIQPGVTDEPWAFWDFLPTVASLAGAPSSSLPKDIDGRSIVPLLEGSGAYNGSARTFYWEFCTSLRPWTGQKGSGWTHALRQGQWKIVSFEKDGPYRLYDLSNDLGEQHDLAADHPDIVDRLAKLAQAEHVESKLFPSTNCHPS